MTIKIKEDLGIVITNYLFAMSAIATAVSFGIFAYGCYCIEDMITIYKTDLLYIGIYVAAILATSVMSLMVVSGKISFRSRDWELFAFKIQQ